MKNSILFFVLFFSFSSITAQYEYAESNEHPYGLPNPEAPRQIKDFEPMIGLCDCKSTTRKQDGSWAEPVDMTWKFKYIMNGMAVQDETLKADGIHSGSIRQFNADSSKWHVYYYTVSSIPKALTAWEGNNKDNKIILTKEQAAPNGMEGFYRLTFYDMSKLGYKWIGEWVDKAGTIVYPTWKITCTRKE